VGQDVLQPFDRKSMRSQHINNTSAGQPLTAANSYVCASTAWAATQIMATRSASPLLESGSDPASPWRPAWGDQQGGRTGQAARRDCGEAASHREFV